MDSTLFSAKDQQQIRDLGIRAEQIDWQMKVFREGVSYLQLDRPAIIGDGIINYNDEEKEALIREYEVASGLSRLKFVPASGAASRMFKSLFEYLDQDDSPNMSNDRVIGDFIGGLKNFAFYRDMERYIASSGKSIDTLIRESDHREIISALLSEKGLGYGSLPKGLLKFHNYSDTERTAFEEHLAEGALYASDKNNKVNIHFTVSPEHRMGFENLLEERRSEFEKKFGVKYSISFSVQKLSTDTLAVDMENKPFRESDGSLLFRPGGHGALINNLDELDADIIFIKNIDNVVPENRTAKTVEYKKLLAGKLITLRARVFGYIRELTIPGISNEKLKEISDFIRDELCYHSKQVINFADRTRMIDILKTILNRPIRVCGVVKNLGEPGGGPFWAPNSKGDISLQIIESSQVDPNNPSQKNIFSGGTHFNPVDLVCSTKDYLGKRFELSRFVDPGTCFISHKSKDGRELKALELPGLWNGAMADWLTIFVEVPVETFNPVKTVNDLLRPEHQ